MKVLLYQFFINDNHITDKRNLKNIQGYWELSHNSCKLYAEKNGWDYYLEYHDNRDFWNPTFFKDSSWFERFNAVKYLKDYDAVVYMDSDILIKPSTEDIVKKYRKDKTNIVLNTAIGNRLLGETSRNYTIGSNSGVVIFYNESKNTKSLYSLKPRNYAWDNNVFTLSEFIKKRQDLYWWEKWEDFSDFTGSCKFGLRHIDMWFPFIISTYVLSQSHLHEKYNWKFTPKNENKILSDGIQIIHYEMDTKQYMEKHYNLIMSL